VLSKLLKVTVEIHLQRTRFKDGARKTVFFAYFFLENEARINKNNQVPMLFMPKQVSVPKISLIVQQI